MKRFLFSLFAALIAGAAIAQNDKSPADWEITATPGEKGIYNLNFMVRLGGGWHIWTLHPGADSSLIPPSIEVDATTAKVAGQTSEQGIATDLQIPGIEGVARFYVNQAMFIQPVQAKAGSTVKGSYTYQLCNDQLCLPPKTVPFTVKLP